MSPADTDITIKVDTSQAQAQLGALAKAMEPVTPSPRYSFKGYDPMVWVVKNATFLKTSGAAIVAALGAQQWKVAAAIAGGVVIRWAFDALDYFVTVNPA